MPHVNFHSCVRAVGFCTPFVSNQPGLSTHTAAQTGEFEGEQISFNQTLSLGTGDYTVIAHARWFDESGLKHDMSRATFAHVSAPPPQYVHIDCPPGYIIAFNRRTGTSCQPCGKGTYEEAGVLCQPSDSLHYVPHEAQNETGTPCGIGRKTGW